MKRFIALILAILMIVTFTACEAEENEKTKFVKTGEVYIYNGYHVQVVYDPETKVEYFMRGDLMCPRYDKNGELMFYKGN